MVKAKTKKRRLERALTVLALAAMVAAIVYFAGYRPYTIRKEKQQFKQAEAYVAQLANQIQQKVGKANQVRTENSCDRSNRKFENGPLYCGVNVTVTYLNTDDTTSTKVMNTSSTLAAGTQLTLLGDPVSSFTPASINQTPQEISQSISGFQNIICNIFYTYPIDKSSTDRGINIDLSCGGPAKTEYYPAKP